MKTLLCQRLSAYVLVRVVLVVSAQGILDRVVGIPFAVLRVVVASAQQILPGRLLYVPVRRNRGAVQLLSLTPVSPQYDDVLYLVSDCQTVFLSLHLRPIPPRTST